MKVKLLQKTFCGTAHKDIFGENVAIRLQSKIQKQYCTTGQ